MQTVTAAKAQGVRVIARGAPHVRRGLASSSAGSFFGTKIPAAMPRRAGHKLAKASGVVALFGTTKADGSIYNFTVKSIDGRDVNLSKFKGKVGRRFKLGLCSTTSSRCSKLTATILCR
jgi:hypothetical protein